MPRRGWMPAAPMRAHRLDEGMPRRRGQRPAQGRPGGGRCLDGLPDGVQERLQTAERERAVADAKAVEERRRRRVQLALAASVLAMMLGGGAFAFWRNEQVQLVRQRDARNAEAVAALLNQCEECCEPVTRPRRRSRSRRRGSGRPRGSRERGGRLGLLEADLCSSRSGCRRPVPMDPG